MATIVHAGRSLQVTRRHAGRSLQVMYCDDETNKIGCLNFTAAEYSHIRTWNIVVFAVLVPFFIILPCCYFRCRRLLRNRRQQQSAISPSERYSDSPTVARLVASERDAALYKARVSGTIAQVGWVLCCFGLGALALSLFVPLDFFAGDITNFLVPMHLGPAILCLSIRPTDVRQIVIACRFMLFLLFLLTPSNLVFFLSALAGVGDDGYGAFGFLVAVINFLLCIAILWRAVFDKSCCCRCKASSMPPRRQLQRLWLAMRLFIFTDALIFTIFDLVDLAITGSISLTSRSQVATFVFIFIGIVSALALTPANRGRIHSWLGSLGKHASKEQEAAAVAALIGGRAGGAAAVLARAQSRFRALPITSLTTEELQDNRPNPGLSQKTAKAILGDVAAFVSHSWSDCGASKFRRLQEYATAREGAASPNHGAAAVSIWLDKACIDQNSIEESLECLPVYLSGCNDLLVLVGKTYHTRLWCVMELFVYLRMGKSIQEQRDNMVVRLLDDDDDATSENLSQLLARFDAGRSRCYLDGDRQKLLAVIEASFGSFTPFNKVVRRIFHDKLAPLEGVAAGTGAGEAEQ